MHTLLELGRRYGELAWAAGASFEVAGAWAREASDPGAVACFTEHSYRFAFHADRLRWLVPEIAGLSVAEQVQHGPVDPLTDGASTPERRAALAATWSSLAAGYASLLAEANPVSDGAAERWLRLLHADAVEAAVDAAP